MKTTTFSSSVPRVIKPVIVRQKNLVLTMYVRHHKSILIKSAHNPSKGFYVFRVPDCTPDKTQMLSQTWTSAKPAYDSPAQVRGSAQLIPRSKFLSTGVTILNFRLESFQLDTGDLGKTLEPIASAFFPQKSSLLISESIMFDLTQSPHKHKRNIQKVIKKLSKARWVSQTRILYAIPLASPTWSLGCGLSSTLKTAIILITTHAESGTGYLATSLGHYVDINEVCSLPHVFL